MSALSHMPLASLYPEELAPATGQQCEASCWQVLPLSGRYGYGGKGKPQRKRGGAPFIHPGCLSRATPSGTSQCVLITVNQPRRPGDLGNG